MSNHISDIEMPKMNGLELLQKVSTDQRLPHLPAVMITSRIADKHRQHAMKLVANGYLGKPYTDVSFTGFD